MNIKILGLWFLFFGSIVSAQDISGIIYFEDGTTQEFTRLEAISAFLEGGTSNPEMGFLSVEYKNTIRSIPYSKLKSIEVLKFNIGVSRRLAKVYLEEPILKIQTTTGVSLETRYRSVHSIYVLLHDELTGELINQDVAFARNEKLNIRKVEFNNPQDSYRE